MADKVKPEGEAKPPKLVYLRLEVPLHGLVVGRVVSASTKTAARLKTDKLAITATKAMIAVAGGNIPHIHE